MRAAAAYRRRITAEARGVLTTRVMAAASTRVPVSLAHLLVATGFFLPWVAGPFGPRETLSGLDLVRVSESAAAVDPEFASRARALAFAAATIPGMAAAGLTAAWVAPRFGWRPDLAMRLSIWLAVLSGVVGLVPLVAITLLARSSEVVGGPLVGLYAMAAGSLLAIISLVVRRR